MLRPSNSLLGSSRAARRRTVRAERVRAVGQLFRAVSALVRNLWGTAFDLLLLLGLPLLYLAAAYFILDVPARWLWTGERFTWASFALFVAALFLGVTGIGRAVQGAPPIAPVRPAFARAMLGLSWIAGLLLTLGDLAS